MFMVFHAGTASFAQPFTTWFSIRAANRYKWLAGRAFAALASAWMLNLSIFMDGSDGLGWRHDVGRLWLLWRGRLVGGG